MAFAHHLLPAPLACSSRTETPILRAGAAASSYSVLPVVFPSSSSSSTTTITSNRVEGLRPLIISAFRRGGFRARAEIQESGGSLAADAFEEFKHMLLPITDRNPYLSEGTRQVAATATALAKKYGSDITVVVIDEKPKDSIPEHDAQLSSIRWHLSQGGFQKFGLMERLGEGKKPTAIIGEVADEMNMDLVVLSMEAIHSKHVDANLLAEFIPCPVLLLPL
ncbi:uncharacterized protein LOC131243198 [Magnolia sinica]|uniref:uncharacterized protein LOC131243198 n=1 Tax=Magnolia sinica TaxID=86752 RepID=UPI00265A3B8C|nr:uncharacterized protein LOC131243198 [Magnolia sinica]